MMEDNEDSGKTLSVNFDISVAKLFAVGFVIAVLVSVAALIVACSRSVGVTTNDLDSRSLAIMGRVDQLQSNVIGTFSNVNVRLMTDEQAVMELQKIILMLDQGVGKHERMITNLEARLPAPKKSLW